MAKQFFAGTIVREQSATHARATALKWAKVLSTYEKPSTIGFFDGSHETTTTAGGIRVCFRELVPSPDTRYKLVKKACYLNPTSDNVHDEGWACVFFLETVYNLILTNPEFLKGKTYQVHAFTDCLSWLTILERGTLGYDAERTKFVYGIGDTIIRMSHKIRELGRYAKINVQLSLHWCPRDVANSVVQHDLADHLSRSAKLTGMSFDSEHGNEFEEYVEPLFSEEVKDRAAQLVVQRRSHVAVPWLDVCAVRQAGTLMRDPKGRLEPGECFAPDWEEIERARAANQNGRPLVWTMRRDGVQNGHSKSSISRHAPLVYRATKV